jgi:hypothetical protein
MQRKRAYEGVIMKNTCFLKLYMLLALIKCLQKSLRREITTKSSISKCWRSCPGEPVTEEGSICCPAQNAQKQRERKKSLW